MAVTMETANAGAPYNTIPLVCSPLSFMKQGPGLGPEEGEGGYQNEVAGMYPITFMVSRIKINRSH